ncbi:DUF3667 domain-containing protein [Fulvivirgaceae bacterium BMA10]|uniref:DUF3667 domain-containing protein n=1 Tax=Splendidivirga corallicola TaxID=3051826 RepID=A0ABT8KLY9_9BACT|nr:DUF3667 domain-containing protein [Fulvivirgaceae bacterium BMA10]
MNLEKSRLCPNCNNNLEQDFKFCPGCGQSAIEKVVSFKQFISDFLGDYFTFDSKIFRSLIPLMFKPGFLTQEYLVGRRVRYIPPLRFYIFISIIFFLIFSLGPSAEEVISSGDETANEMEDARFDSIISKLYFVLLPVFALILQLLYYKKKRLYLGHFIFSLHFHSFVFVLFSVYLLITTYLFAGHVIINGVVLTTFLVLVALYLYIALKRVYEQNYIKTFLKFVLLTGSYLIIMISFLLLALLIFYSLSYGF